jgi:hypothetical protein
MKAAVVPISRPFLKLISSSRALMVSLRPDRL